jgi:hypothetical protein
MAETQSDATDASVSNEEASGNISETELVSRLTQRYENLPQEDQQPEAEGEGEVEQNNPDESDSSTELIDELSGESEAEESDGESESSETEAEDEPISEDSESSDVLSQLGIDTEGLSEEQIQQLTDALGRDKMLKRINKLTAQKKEAQEQLEQVQQKSQPKQEVATADLNSPVADILDPAELDKQADQIEELLDWSVESLMQEDKYDDDGNEYLAEKDGKRYSREQLKAIRENAKNALGKTGFIANQRKFIEQRQQADQLAVQTFDFFKEGQHESEEYQIYASVKQDPTMGKILDMLPNANYMIGLMIEGQKVIAEKQGKAPAKKVVKKKAPVAPIPSGSSSKKATGNTAEKSALAKRIAAAEKTYSETGSTNDRIRLAELRGQLKNL